MQQVGELRRPARRPRVGEQRPGLERHDLRVVLHRGQVERVERLDLVGRTLLGWPSSERPGRGRSASSGRGASGRPGSASGCPRSISGWRPRRGRWCRSEQHDRRGSSASTSSCSRISTPRVVSPLMPRFATFTPGKRRPRPPPQPCVIESPRKTTAPWSCCALVRPGRAALAPELLEPVVAADRPGSGQAVVGRGDQERVARRSRGLGSRRARRAEQGGERRS